MDTFSFLLLCFLYCNPALKSNDVHHCWICASSVVFCNSDTVFLSSPISQRYETLLKDMEKKSEQHREVLTSLQQDFQKAQGLAAKWSSLSHTAEQRWKHVNPRHEWRDFAVLANKHGVFHEILLVFVKVLDKQGTKGLQQHTLVFIKHLVLIRGTGWAQLEQMFPSHLTGVKKCSLHHLQRKCFFLHCKQNVSLRYLYIYRCSNPWR